MHLKTFEFVFRRGSQEICQRLFGEQHGSLALGSLALARCFRAEGELRKAVQSYARSLELFNAKTAEETDEKG